MGMELVFFKTTCSYCGSIAVGEWANRRAYCVGDKDHILYLTLDKATHSISEEEYNKLKNEKPN